METIQTALKDFGLCVPIIQAQPIETQQVKPRPCVPKPLKNQFMDIARELSVRDVVINDDNRSAYSDLFNYFTNNDSRKLDKNKGVMLIGDTGVGKTLLMKSIHGLCSRCKNLELFNYLTMSNLKDLVIASKKDDEAKNYFNSYYNSINCNDLYVDDIGTESKEMNSYGNVSLWFEEYLMERYVLFTDYGIKLHCSTNLNSATLKAFYSKRIIDRFNEMFNFVIMKGVSFR